MRPDTTASRRPEAIHRRVAASLGGRSVDGLAATLAAEVRDDAAYEASIRIGPDGTPRAGRMMIERASAAILGAVADALEVRLPASSAEWLDCAEAERVPLIAGWDRRGDGARRCVKLYVNASDAGAAVRERLCAALLPHADVERAAVAVIGMNACADGEIENKVYLQEADARRLAGDFGARARELAAVATDVAAAAGGVASFDVSASELKPRAFFVALREPRGGDWPFLRSLPGYDPERFATLLPFAPAHPRSLGMSLGEDSWTLYCKPRHSGRAPEALEPVAIFRGDDGEVGVFVEPTEMAPRAFRRTERHAVSVRVREGDPAPRALEALVDWFTAELRGVEGGGVAEASFACPPAPWSAVGRARPTGGRGG